MHRDFSKTELTHAAKYLIEHEDNLISSLANLSALIHATFQPIALWSGFYLVINNRLELGPFQGPIACSTIPFGKGVCGKAWRLKQTIIVENVHEFDGHISCSNASNSEIVVPIVSKGLVKGVLDVDSSNFSAFNTAHQQELELICALIAKQFFS